MSPDRKTITPAFFQDAYTRDYAERIDSDSPPGSRRQMLDTLLRYLNNHSSQQRVLNIGAGPQRLEWEMLQRKDYQGLLNKDLLHWMTLDIAHLQRHRLKTQFPHITANGEHICVPNNSITHVISNMAIDFMPRGAFKEVARILKPHGVFIANLHHPHLKNMSEDAIVHFRKIKVDFCRQLKMLDTHARSSTTYTKRTDALKEKIANTDYSLNNAQFIIDHFPDLIFPSAQAILQFFASQPELSRFNVSVKENSWDLNSWYHVVAIKD